MSSEAEENKALVRRFFEERGKGNLDVIDELLVPDFVDRTLMPGQGPTREDYKRSVAQMRDVYSITSFTIEEQIAEGDTVVTKYRESSVQRREIIGLPPTGEKAVEGIYIHRISGGKITEEWGIFDALPAMEDLAQEIREQRAHRAGTQGSKGHPASLSAQGDADPGGLADHSTLPASP